MTSVAPGGPTTGNDPPLELEKEDVPNTLIDSIFPAPGALTTGRPLFFIPLLLPRKAHSVIIFRELLNILINL